MTPDARSGYLASPLAPARSPSAAFTLGGTGKSSCRRPAILIDADHRGPWAREVAWEVAAETGGGAA